MLFCSVALTQHACTHQEVHVLGNLTLQVLDLAPHGLFSVKSATLRTTLGAFEVIQLGQEVGKRIVF